MNLVVVGGKREIFTVPRIRMIQRVVLYKWNEIFVIF